MKKIVFFLGRKHHAEKLVPVAIYGQETGVIEPIFLIADNAINIDPPSEFVGNFHPVVNGSNTRHLKSYEYKSQDINDSVHEVLKNVFNAKTTEFIAPFWLTYSVREMVRVSHSMSSFLDDVNPDAIFVLHSQNFWTKQLVYLANQRDIETYSLQEGLILVAEDNAMGKYKNMGEYMTNIFAWSDDNTDIFGQYKNIVVPTGAPHLDQWMYYRDTERERIKLRYSVLSELQLTPQKPTILFAFPLLHTFLGDPIEALRIICNWTLRNNINTVVSFHPFESNKASIIKYTQRFPYVKIYEGDPLPILLSSDVLICQTSTIAVEALMMGVHVVEYDPNYMGLKQSLYDKGAAQLMTGGDLTPLRLALENKPMLDYKKFSDFISKLMRYSDGNASKRIMESIAPDYGKEEEE